MAKEMMIVFVYDTLRCMAEADDPADAVLYFHPGWVSDSQRIALCGQLMGVTHCLKAMFTIPKILTLHSGKFVIQEYGRFVLAIGSDRNIPDWMLKNRSEMLTSFIKTYHCDLQTVAAQFPGENNPRFSEKLYQMFETYLPVLQFGGYMFQSVPLLDLPKSATNIFLEAMQILQHCQTNKGVLGGTILFNNKIVATQLSPRLTSRLAMVDPYRIKSPGEFVDTEYDLPIGVQLLAIYIRKRYFSILRKDAEKMHSWHINDFEKIKIQKINRLMSKEPILNSMKRDKSLLFTAVPEEDITTSPSPTSSPSGIKVAKESKDLKPNIPDVVPFSNKPRVRPNKLALSFKHSVSKSIDEDNNIMVPQPEPAFMGQTSVCSTPLLEFKRLHGNMMSICRTSDDKFLSEALNFTASTIDDESNSSVPVAEIALQDMPVRVRRLTDDVLKEEMFNNSLKDIKTSNEHFIAAPTEKIKQSNSLSDINSGFKLISQFSTMRYGRHGKSMSLNADESPIEEFDDKKSSVTITDPSYPVFRNDGVPISKYLFDEYLCQQYPEKPPLKPKDMFNDKQVSVDSKISKDFEGFDSTSVNSSPMRRKSHDVSINKLTKIEMEKSDQSRRKSLTLPLKSLGGDKNTSDLDSQSSSSLFDTHRKKLSGVQLTPLMEKLSHLAFSEKSSGYSSRGITPMEFKDFALSTPCIEKNVTFPKEEKSKKTIETPISDDSDSDEDTNITSYRIDCTKCVLYVSGLQNMSMMLILEEEAADDPQIIQNLWDINLKCLGSVEQLCMEPLPSGDESSESYSFLSLDPQWGTVKKGGAWASLDVATMGYIHNNFKGDTALTEFIIRSEDSLVYGTSCGGSETYYQENGSKQPGLPTQADLMGTAPLKSKRRLQRDHSITIF